MKYSSTLSLALVATAIAVPAPKNNAIIITSSGNAALLGGAAGAIQAGNAANAGADAANADANAGAKGNANADANAGKAAKGNAGNNANNGNNAGNNANASSANAGNVNAATQQTVSDTIQKWLSDIATVNNFVDTAGQLTDAQQISDFAAKTFVAAQDEGTSNTALQQAVQLDASGLSAAQDLLNQFNIIGPAINDTISNPQNLQKNLDAINGARYVRSEPF